eukprot:5994589-Prymnesium_polylepis.1
MENGTWSWRHVTLLARAQLATRGLRGKGALDREVLAHVLVLAQVLQLEVVAAVLRADAVLGVDESTEHRGRHPGNLFPGHRCSRPGPGRRPRHRGTAGRASWASCRMRRLPVYGMFMSCPWHGRLLPAEC